MRRPEPDTICLCRSNFTCKFTKKEEKLSLWIFLNDSFTLTSHIIHFKHMIDSSRYIDFRDAELGKEFLKPVLRQIPRGRVTYVLRLLLFAGADPALADFNDCYLIFTHYSGYYQRLGMKLLVEAGLHTPTKHIIFSSMTSYAEDTFTLSFLIESV